MTTGKITHIFRVQSCTTSQNEPGIWTSFAGKKWSIWKLSTIKHKTGTETTKGQNWKRDNWWTGAQALMVADGWTLGSGWWGGVIPEVSLLLLGEFQRVAEDLDSRLFKTESTCLGRLIVDAEHLPKKPRERHTVFHTGQTVTGKKGEVCDATSCVQTSKQPPTV